MSKLLPCCSLGPHRDCACQRDIDALRKVITDYELDVQRLEARVAELELAYDGQEPNFPTHLDGSCKCRRGGRDSGERQCICGVVHKRASRNPFEQNMEGMDDG